MNEESGGDPKEYAETYLRHRLQGFDKDMKICLTGIPRLDRPNELTHAYFPALMNCCGMLELLGCLYVGNTKAGWKRSIDYSNRFLDSTDYCKENIILLFEVLRHPTAHFSTGSGVKKPDCGEHKGDRITWTIFEDDLGPAIELREESGVLQDHPPWNCPYDSRLHVRLKRLQCDIRGSVLGQGGYLAELLSDDDLMGKFRKCMKQIYPPADT